MVIERTTWLGYAVLCVITLVLVHLSNHLFGRRRKLNLPPGPKPWPIIGNFNHIGRLPFISLHELSKKYGPIMTLWYGSVPVVVGSSVEMAKLFLKTHDDAFAGRPQLAAGKYTNHAYSGITWTQYSPYLSQVRKLCFMELFSSKRLDSFEYIRIEELNCFLKGIYKQSLSGKPILLRDPLFNSSINNITRMIIGKRYEVDDSTSGISEFRHMVDEYFVLNGVYNLGDWIPLLKHLDVQGYVNRMKALGEKLEVFFENVLDEHNARRAREKENWVPKDVFDLLLKIADDPTYEIKLGTEEVKAISQDLMMAGADTSPLSVEWAMSEILKHPTVHAKAVEELDRVIGRERWVAEKDIQNLPYLRAIIKETMRLRSVAYTLAPHYAREYVRIQGYDIPKGTVVIVNTYSTQRDPKVYERPEEFRPERFLEKNIDVKGQHFELLPFGSGRRMCLGYSHGLKIVESTLANLLHGFTWKLPNDMKPEDLDMEGLNGLTITRKNPLVAIAAPRLPPHLYQAL